MCVHSVKLAYHLKAKVKWDGGWFSVCVTLRGAEIPMVKG